LVKDFVVFCLNDISVSTTTQPDGSYQTFLRSQPVFS